MESPPKRVTRARAAAKKDDVPSIKTTKIATAASKAKAPRVTATTKRKTRADEEKEDEEAQHDDEIIEPEPVLTVKTTRGRPKKTAAVQPEDEEMMDAPPVRATRGKVAVVEPEEMEDFNAAPKTTRGRPKKVVEAPLEPVKTTRGRPKKMEVPAEEVAPVEEPKRATRGRAATVTKPTAPKKTVKFEEPDKENIIPIAAVKGKSKVAEVATGLRAKPVRKPAVPARATRGRGKVEDKKEGSSPLSPKKVTQVGTAVREQQSEDELAAAEKTPMKPLMKSPVKPPGSIFSAAKKLNFSASGVVPVNRMIVQDLSASVMASPARRPPQSPFKETMKTSPQRTAVPALHSSTQSPFKPSLGAPKSPSQNSTFKSSLLQSPARRPVSPMKVNESGSPSRDGSKPSLFGSTPKATPFKISRFATPRTLNLKGASRPGQMLPPPSAPPKFATGSPKASLQTDDSTMIVEPRLKFSGRLSSIMPRSADPVLNGTSMPIVENVAQESHPEPESMEFDDVETIAVEAEKDVETTTPLLSPPRHSTGSFELRRRDESPFDDSDSEDELASGSPKYSPAPLSAFKVSAHDFASSPVPFEAISTPKPAKSARPSLAALRSERRDKIGFTPLAAQLSNWLAASPEKSESGADEEESPTASPTKNATAVDAPVELSPAKSHFFDDEMSVRDEMAAAPEPVVTDIEQDFGPVELDDEDMALADEADEMSLLDPDQLEIPDQDEDMFAMPEVEQTADDEVTEQVPVNEVEFVIGSSEHQAIEEFLPAEQSEDLIDELDFVQQHEATEYFEDVPPSDLLPVLSAPRMMDQTFEQAVSEASQEYGDENAIPIDPALFAPVPPEVPTPPSLQTPMRVLKERTYHTVSKVPLKPAAADSPMRPSPLKRSSSVSRVPSQRPTSNLTRKNTVICYSPQKSTPRAKTPQRDLESTPKTEWSTAASPARTPRSDLNTQLLKGAVVYVDVHTTEGADASVLFTELLTQMGARCVKTWSWNPHSEDGSKIGITHVVYKDGGKKTLERARESNGVVSCVGVGWVLDCERENQWLPESPYAVDTALVPRGGHRRRKSMEPKALANLNGTLVPSSTPSRSSSVSLTATPLTSKSRRRDSVQWERSSHAPSHSPDVFPNESQDFLSPIPSTPAVSIYPEEGLYGAGDETPGAQTPYFLKRGELMQKTAPVKRFFGDGEESGEQGWLSEKKDENVMARLMAARRKSLQWAPKVGSPLAR